MDQARRNPDDFVWTHVPSIEELGRRRMGAMRRFHPRLPGRHGPGALPRRIAARACRFPTAPSTWGFRPTSCFLYSEQFDLAFHLEALREMLRVAAEVRVFPLLQVGGAPSPHVPGAVEAMRTEGVDAAVEPVPYEFSARRQPHAAPAPESGQVEGRFPRGRRAPVVTTSSTPVPSRLARRIVSVPQSVQYILRPVTSRAIPWGFSNPVVTRSSTSEPSRLARWDAVGSAVRPVYLAAVGVHGDPLRIRQAGRHQVFDAGAVQVGALDLPGARVGPVHLAGGDVQGDPARVSPGRPPGSRRSIRPGRRAGCCPPKRWSPTPSSTSCRRRRPARCRGRRTCP